MNERKEIIIKEIRYWKAHNLLPSHYCDFLLHLYTEGEEEKQARSDSKKRVSLSQLPLYLLIGLLIVQLPITFVIIYFTELSYFLQILLFGTFVMISFVSGYIYYRRKNKWVHLPIVSGALVLFLSSVHIITSYLSADKWTLVIVILMNCILWVLLGWKTKLTYLLIAGIVGAILLGSYNLF